MNRQTAELFDRTLKFAIDTIAYVDGLPRTIGAETVARQLARSSASIGANLREAQRTRTRAEFLTEFWLRVARGRKLGDPDTSEILLCEAEQLVTILAAIARTTKSRYGQKQPKAQSDF